MMENSASLRLLLPLGGTRQLGLGSARVLPSILLTILFSFFEDKSLSDEVCGETPQTTRETRMLPFLVAWFRLMAVRHAH